MQLATVDESGGPNIQSLCFQLDKGKQKAVHHNPQVDHRVHEVLLEIEPKVFSTLDFSNEQWLLALLHVL